MRTQIVETQKIVHIKFGGRSGDAEDKQVNWLHSGLKYGCYVNATAIARAKK